ncbi:MAG: GGDEF domain-containing protein [Deltaproteobacteria bacterium]|nr:GGDEF domain-containing protein [Deltaproteobacteria bacterium]NND28575.1 GGDEF domain-containing protein [Myxococcales bacterium]MBT8466440.1 GGDEF domain-containing protein [Deltaproteobacteria bacterium]MBT8480785.1 GGDEF domain-containing protein [Deltaproteobacteria bacterium]NNK06551.1 GGDEF domain-containing protein [Myxococcales bacterium]
MFDSSDLLEKAPRRRFERILFSRCRAGEPFALMLVDLDGFKNVSARFGANVTDLILFEVGSRLRKKLEAGDLVTRSGDQQFAVFVRGIDEMDSANQLAKELIERLQSPVTVRGTRFRLDASIGISLGPKRSGEWRLLLKDTDRAAHEAKTKGRGRISISFAVPELDD